jgi:hypothetical protein
MEDVKPIAMEVSVVSEEKSVLVDSALNFLREAGEPTFSLEEEKALVRKVDWMLMPLLAAVYFLQFVDKNLSTCLHQRAARTLTWACSQFCKHYGPRKGHAYHAAPVFRLSLGILCRIPGF